MMFKHPTFGPGWPFVGMALLLTGCGQAPASAPNPPARSAPAGPATTVAPTSSPAPTMPPGPKHKPKMICRDSQTGAKAKCGAPNAVLVGVETN